MADRRWDLVGAKRDGFALRLLEVMGAGRDALTAQAGDEEIGRSGRDPEGAEEVSAPKRGEMTKARRFLSGPSSDRVID